MIGPLSQTNDEVTDEEYEQQWDAEEQQSDPDCIPSREFASPADAAAPTLGSSVWDSASIDKKNGITMTPAHAAWGSQSFER